MNYYKILKDDAFIGVVTNQHFRVFQQKHQTLLSCDESLAQYIQLGDALYHTGWMYKVITDKFKYENADVIQIDEAEYNALHDAVERGDEIKIEQDQFEPEEEITDIVIEEDVTVEYLRSAKISEMNHACKKSIESGVDVMLNDGNIYHFSLTTQDQLNLITLQSMIASGETNIPYHADGELCRYYSVDDIAVVVDAATAHKTFHVTYFNSLKVYISSLDDIHDISAVRYGTEVPVEYQSDILKNLYASMVM